MSRSLPPNDGRFIRLLLFTLLFLFAVGCKKPPTTRPVPEVQVVTVVPANIPIFEEWVGTLDGFVTHKFMRR